MANCSFCNSFILFGGKKDGNLRFCNDDCQQKGYLHAFAQTLPEDFIQQSVQELHQGQCPQCRGRGPVDVHTSHFVWSMLVLTSWKSKPKVCCRSCGIKGQLGNAFGSAIVGWWGLPHGLIMTPVQIVRNFIGILSPPPSHTPSPTLVNMVRLHLGAQLVAQQHQQQQNPGSQLPVGDPYRSHTSADPYSSAPPTDPYRSPPSSDPYSSRSS